MNWQNYIGRFNMDMPVPGFPAEGDPDRLRGSYASAPVGTTRTIDGGGAGHTGQPSLYLTAGRCHRCGGDFSTLGRAMAHLPDCPTPRPGLPDEAT